MIRRVLRGGGHATENRREMLEGLNRRISCIHRMYSSRCGRRACPSPLEYGCHVREVVRLYDQRLQLMLAQDGPQYPNWDQDATAVADHYGEQDPAVVAAELTEVAETIAARFGVVAGDRWQRTGARSGAEFMVESFARYFIHDPVHHLYDVTGTPPADPAPDPDPPDIPYG